MTSDDYRERLETTLRYAAQSGAWIVERRPREAGAAEALPPGDLPILSAPGGGELAAIREKLGDCRRCGLHQGRTHIVFGVGDPGARLMFVGEGPGEEEDRRGEPFVGRAGQLLDKMIAAMGFARREVYIANVVKCRPPKNRDPHPEEEAACSPFLWEQIDAIAPTVIVALGAHAARALTGQEKATIGQLRGRIHTARGHRVFATYHPAYLLRTPSAKRAAWEDLKKVRALLSA